MEQLDFEDISQRLYKGLVPYSPVNTPLDLVDERQMNEGKRWMHLKVGDKSLKVPKLPIAFGRSEDFEVRENPGNLGAHTDTILATLGYSAADIQKLKADQIVLKSSQMLNTEDKAE